MSLHSVAACATAATARRIASAREMFSLYLSCVAGGWWRNTQDGAPSPGSEAASPNIATTRGRRPIDMAHVQVGRREEHVDPVARRVAHGLEAPVNVLRRRARQARDDHRHTVGAARSTVADLARDRADGLKVALRCDREARLDDIDAHVVEGFASFSWICGSALGGAGEVDVGGGWLAIVS